ncbi:hypothetical protein BROUX41_004328 [Berkeleyomyces rouxiae]|uniref:uncharacterized protein n=1 Tax=Berkeleyomyces rouxiae TaxID=2035830 RepID=UPI003B8021C5
MIQSLSSPIHLARRIFRRKSAAHGQQPIEDLRDASRSKKNNVDYILVVSSGPKRWLPSRQGYAEYPSSIFAPDGSMYKDSARIESKAGYITFSNWGCEHCVPQGVKENADPSIKAGTMAVLLEIKTVKLSKLSRQAIDNIAGDGKEGLLCFGQNTSPRNCVICSSKKIRKMRSKLRWKTVGIPAYMSGNPECTSDEEDLGHRVSWEKQSLERYSSLPEEPLPWHKV